MTVPTAESLGGGGPHWAAPARPVGEIVFACVILSLGVVGFMAGADIRTPPSASDIGPRAFPFVVSGLLVLIGVGLILQLLRGHVGVAEEGEDVDPSIKTDWLTVVKLVGFVIVHIVLIVPLGWPVAAAVLFFGAAWSLGAKPWWRNALTGIVLALILQFVFAGLLGVSLPAGFLLEGVAIFNG
ncbi:tripartite tricarboxylate transporter TctB family protein [Cryobacterium sp. Hh7]|uniref:tripartite tricarboxylate transporter TctB family protein n=1 Tax=unclassified Cryobacterium TaxID=2649013 RepID=UPI00106CF5B0|nr:MULTISPECIES: tripartite tricarboxylate transporter TctB family protein [unclassified Cryobacterium]TFD52544.1 tripartite tricarboxylate transporter TctB family protein [Cryobacterium sp. Hh11]TFD58354.1 tripartite tricarboxylate transporter TctB family protein [Cryobacterium sp. Hh7]